MVVVNFVTVNLIHLGGEGTVREADSDAVSPGHLVHGLEHFVVFAGYQHVAQGQDAARVRGLDEGLLERYFGNLRAHAGLGGELDAVNGVVLQTGHICVFVQQPPGNAAHTALKQYIQLANAALYGLADQAGNLLVPCLYENLGYDLANALKLGYVYAVRDGKSGFVSLADGSEAGFEFMAQGISALTGITNTMKGRTPLPGFILSVMEFKSEVGYLKNNTTIQMKIAEDFRDEENHVYRYICELYANKGDEKPSVTSKISVMETEDVHALFGD